MWRSRSRSRARLGLGLGAIVLALTRPAVPDRFAAAQAGTAHPAVDWLPILLVVTGLVLVAGLAGLAAFRPLRRGRRRAARRSPAPGYSERMS